MFGRSFKRRAVLAAALVVPLVLPTTATAAPATWRMVDLGAGGNSYAIAINDRGHVIGGLGNGHGFLWREGQFTDLGAHFAPFDINNRDEIVGYQWGEGDRATLWRDGTLIDIGALPGAEASRATAINNRSEVVGYSDDYTGQTGSGAFLWRNGAMTRLGTVDPYTVGQATDINDRGQIVGVATYFDNAVVRWWHGTVTPLVTSPVNIEPTGINKYGVIIGRRWTGETETQSGFVWRRGTVTEIPMPPGSPQDNPLLAPWGINGHMQIVGSSTGGPFVWEDGRMTILPTTAGLGGPQDINEHGVIAGSNVTLDGDSTADPTVGHAVIWIRTDQ